MPLPMPHDDESKDAFVSRCMGLIGDEFSDKDQRLAVCFSQWEKKSKADDLETRFFASFERREIPDLKTRQLIGYAAKFQTLSEPMGGFRETIRKGAFERSIASGADVKALREHDPGKLLGRTRSRTLRIAEDKIGLHVEMDLPDTSDGRDVWELVGRGDLSQMSFAFRTKRDEWENFDDGSAIRTLVDVDLYDVSVVTYPAYQDTVVAVRSLNQWRSTQQPTSNVAHAQHAGNMVRLWRARLNRGTNRD